MSGSKLEAPGSTSMAGNSEAYSVPSETNVAVGRQLLNKSLRSIVMSRTAFTLFHGFNPAQDKDGPSTPPYSCWIRDVVCTCPSTSGSASGGKNNAPIPNFTVVPDDEEYDKLLLQSFSFTNETNITRDMVRRLRTVCDEQHGQKKLITFAEANVVIMPEKKKKCPRLDVAFGSKDGGSLDAFVEVGLTPKDTLQVEIDRKIDQLFWKKINQAVNYLALLSTKGVAGKDQDGEEYSLQVDKNKTLLLCVIVMTRDRSKGRIAMFACEPKKDEEWRMALLWRKEAAKEEISQAFGYFVAAIKYMADNEFNLDVEEEEWEYMGPNCSKVTVTCAQGSPSSCVLRSYDNRVRQTSRSPFLYHNWDKIKDDTKVVNVWREGTNGSNIDFRDKTYSQQSTLFRSDEKCGQLEVIAVPFISGKHTCSSVEDALHIVRFLMALHASGYIQGDIRALNCIFAGKDSAMIDFDFGGTEQDCYPPGYATVLPDGRRGVDGEIQETNLSKKLDIKALQYVLGGLHRIEGSGVPGAPLEQLVLNVRWDQLEMVASLEEMEEILREISSEKLVLPKQYFADFMKKYERGKNRLATKQTLDGDPLTPGREKTLPSKRHAPEGS